MNSCLVDRFGEDIGDIVGGELAGPGFFDHADGGEVAKDAAWGGGKSTGLKLMGRSLLKRPTAALHFAARSSTFIGLPMLARASKMHRSTVIWALWFGGSLRYKLAHSMIAV